MAGHVRRGASPVGASPVGRAVGAESRARRGSTAKSVPYRADAETTRPAA